MESSIGRNPQYEATVIRTPEGCEHPHPLCGAEGKRVFFYSGTTGTHQLQVQGQRSFFSANDTQVDEWISSGMLTHPRPYKFIAETGYLKTPLFDERHQLNGAIIQTASGVTTVQIGTQFAVKESENRRHQLPSGAWKIVRMEIDKLGLIHIFAVTNDYGPAIEREVEVGDFVKHIDIQQFDLLTEN